MQQHVVVCQQQPLGVIPSRAFLFSVFTACRSSNSETGERNSLCFYFTKLWCKNTQKEEGEKHSITIKNYTSGFKNHTKISEPLRFGSVLISQKNSSKYYDCLQLQAHLNLFFYKRPSRETCWESTCKSVPPWRVFFSGILAMSLENFMLPLLQAALLRQNKRKMPPSTPFENSLVLFASPRFLLNLLVVAQLLVAANIDMESVWWVSQYFEWWFSSYYWIVFGIPAPLNDDRHSLVVLVWILLMISLCSFYREYHWVQLGILTKNGSSKTSANSHKCKEQGLVTVKTN